MAKRPQNSPQIPSNLSLHVLSGLLWLKSQNFRELPGLGASKKEAVLSSCNFATTDLTACVLNFYLPSTSRHMKLGVAKPCHFGKWCFCPPPKLKEGVWTKTAKMTNSRPNHKNKRFGPRSPQKKRKWRVSPRQEAWWLTKSMVYFFPEKWRTLSQRPISTFGCHSCCPVSVTFCQPQSIVAQCSATPASVAATPPCSATPFQRQLDVRHPWQLKGDRCDRLFGGGVARHRCYT